MGDDPEVRRALAASVTGLGVPVIEARDGVEALARVERGPRPAAILLDLWKPAAERAEFLASLREHPQLSHVPLMTMTARSESRPADGRGRDRAFDVDEVARILVSLCEE